MHPASSPCMCAVCVYCVCCLHSYISLGSYLCMWGSSWADEEAIACASASMCMCVEGVGIKKQYGEKAGCGYRSAKLEGRRTL